MPSLRQVPSNVAMQADTFVLTDAFVPLPENAPLKEPSDLELPAYFPETVPSLLMVPDKVADVSTGFWPSFPVTSKLAVLDAEATNNRPLQETTVPTVHLDTLPLASKTSVAVVPSSAFKV